VHHPDTAGTDGEQFKRITLARDILCSPALRAHYDHLRSVVDKARAESHGIGRPHEYSQPDVGHSSAADWTAAGQDGSGAPSPPAVYRSDLVMRVVALPFGLVVWSAVGVFVGGGLPAFRDVFVGESTLRVGFFAVLGAIAYFLRWTMYTVALHDQYKYYRAYVAATRRVRRVA
jgi:hypothetical protein